MQDNDTETKKWGSIICQQRHYITGLFHHDDEPFKRFKVLCILALIVSWSLLYKQLRQVCAISVDLKLIAYKTWNVIQRKFFIFHFNKIGKIKGIYRGHKITHNTCSMQCSMGTGLLRQGKCLNFLWLLSVNTHFPDEHSKYSLFLFSRGGGGGGGNLSLQLPCKPEYTRPHV